MGLNYGMESQRVAVRGILVDNHWSIFDLITFVKVNGRQWLVYRLDCRFESTCLSDNLMSNQTFYHF